MGQEAKIERSSRVTPGIALVLLAVPLGLVAVFYYGPFFVGTKGLRGAQGDAAFYTWQAWRAGRLLDGRWWHLAEALGPTQPYPPDNARRPHVYEGVDLLLLSTVTSRLLPEPEFAGPDAGATVAGRGLFSPIVNFHLLTVVVLLANGWAAGWFVYRLTAALGWAALAQVLVTLNWSTAEQVAGHLHLYKHAWVLAAVAAAFLFWERPSIVRGSVVGLCMGMLLATSWHFFYFLGLALGMVLLLLLVRGAVRREHLWGLAAGGLVACVVGGTLTAPYWARRDGHQEQFEKRSLSELLQFSSELSQYVLPPWSRPGELYQSARQRFSSRASQGEIWHYPGLVVLATLAAYGAWRLRRAEQPDREARWMDYLALVSGLLVFISLAGGIGILLYKFFPSFRVYGRAGLMAVGLWAVLVPLVLHRLSRHWRSPTWRGLLLVGCLAVALWEGWPCQAALRLPQAGHTLNMPGWVAWLAARPEQERAAVFPMIMEEHQQLYWWIFHRHAVLNTCDLRFFARELPAAGASGFSEPSPPVLDLLRKRGYAIVILRGRLWRDQPAIEHENGLELIHEGDDWRAYRLRTQKGNAALFHESDKVLRPHFAGTAR